MAVDGMAADGTAIVDSESRNRNDKIGFRCVVAAAYSLKLVSILATANVVRGKRESWSREERFLFRDSGAKVSNHGVV